MHFPSPSVRFLPPFIAISSVLSSSVGTFCVREPAGEGAETKIALRPSLNLGKITQCYNGPRWRLVCRPPFLRLALPLPSKATAPSQKQRLPLLTERSPMLMAPLCSFAVPSLLSPLLSRQILLAGSACVAWYAMACGARSSSYLSCVHVYAN